ncbi:MAG: leucine--tRNA ligase, partial [Spirochaetia bacterium]
WSFSGSTDSVFDQKWPGPVPVPKQVKPVRMAVTVDGKVRGTITVHPNADKAAISAAAKGHPNVSRFLKEKCVSKEIIIPGRIVNFVLKTD